MGRYKEARISELSKTRLPVYNGEKPLGTVLKKGGKGTGKRSSCYKVVKALKKTKCEYTKEEKAARAKKRKAKKASK